jgi:hypothetical protein
MRLSAARGAALVADNARQVSRGARNTSEAVMPQSGHTGHRWRAEGGCQVEDCLPRSRSRAGPTAPGCAPFATSSLPGPGVFADGPCQDGPPPS